MPALHCFGSKPASYRSCLTEHGKARQLDQDAHFVSLAYAGRVLIDWLWRHGIPKWFWKKQWRENETHATADQGAQIIRVRPVQAVETGLGGQENCPRHQARATRPGATFGNRRLTARVVPFPQNRAGVKSFLLSVCRQNL